MTTTEEKTLDEKFKEQRKSMTRTLRWYLTFIFGVVILISGMFGYNALINIRQGEQIHDLEEDHKLLIKANVDENPNNLLLQYLSQKYSLTRGGEVSKNKNPKTKDK